MAWRHILDLATIDDDDDEVYLTLDQAAKHLGMNPVELDQMREKFKYIKNVMDISEYWPLSLVKIIKCLYLPRIIAEIKKNQPKRVIKVLQLRRPREQRSSVLGQERELTTCLGDAPRPWEDTSEQSCREVVFLSEVEDRLVDFKSARKIVVNREVTDQLVSVKTAAELMGEKVATLWAWADRRRLESVKINECQTRSHFVVLRSLAAWLLSDYCRFRKYSYTELGRKLGQDLSRELGRQVAAIIRVTINHWVGQGEIPKMATPGGQPMISARCYQRCLILARRAQSHLPKNRINASIL